MRILAVDYGDRRTGLALSDPTGSLVGFTMVIKTTGAAETCTRILEVAAENGAAEIVLGYPKNMNATKGPRAEKSEALASLLRARGGIPVILWDERLTTVDAHRILSEAGKRGKKRKNTVDAVAASLILEGYLRQRELSG